MSPLSQSWNASCAFQTRAEISLNCTAALEGDNSFMVTPDQVEAHDHVRRNCGLMMGGEDPCNVAAPEIRSMTDPDRHSRWPNSSVRPRSISLPVERNGTELTVFDQVFDSRFFHRQPKSLCELGLRPRNPAIDSI